MSKARQPSVRSRFVSPKAPKILFFPAEKIYLLFLAKLILVSKKYGTGAKKILGTSMQTIFTKNINILHAERTNVNGSTWMDLFNLIKPKNGRCSVLQIRVGEGAHIAPKTPM